MQKSRKRKQHEYHSLNPSKPSSSSKSKPIKQIKITVDSRDAQFAEPYPSYSRPTPEECLAIRNDLLQLHGFPAEFVKYRRRRQCLDPGSTNSLELPSLDGDGSAEKESVLDGLVSTLLSQNTTDVNSQRAFASLKAAFPTWEDVLTAEQNLIENAIRCGGLAPTKASCIKNILSSLMERKGKLCLEYLRDLSIDKIKAELSSFKGIGPKTVACVLMFQLQQDDFPVDTHILQIARTLGWVPAAADAKKTYLHLNQRIPKELKFDLNCLMFTHGKSCRDCGTRKAKQEKKESEKKHCPLLNYCGTNSL